MYTTKIVIKMSDIVSKMANMKLSNSPIRVVLETADTFLKVFTALDELCDSANIIFGDDGISISSMDSSHVCLVAVKFSKEYFHEYVIDSTITVGIKVSNLVRVLKCVEGSVLLECSDDELLVMTQNDRYVMKTMDIESEEMDIPEMDVEVEITADSSVIQKYVKNVSSFGDTIEFKTVDDEIIMKTSGDIGTVELRVDQPVKIHGTMSASFASRYLMTFMKAANISKQIRINLHSELPVMFEYEFAENSFIKFFLAPKITDDDE
jgi:proliferating cell nuclear antigen